MPYLPIGELGVLGGDGPESVGLIARRQFSVGYSDNRETLRRPEMRAVPPVAADCPASDVWNTLPDHRLVDVGVALKHTENVVAIEEIENLVGIGDAQAMMRRRHRRFWHVGEIARPKRNMNRNDDRRSHGHRLQIGGEPLKLRVVDATLVGAIGGDADGVEQNEVVTLMIE